MFIRPISSVLVASALLMATGATMAKQPFVVKKITPAAKSFPSVDPATQKGRDDTRWTILVRERETETSFLTAAKTVLASAAPDKREAAQKDVDLHTTNLAALNEELANIGKAAAAPKVASSGCQPPPAPEAAPIVKTPSDSAMPYWAIQPWQPKTPTIQPASLVMPKPAPATPSVPAEPVPNT